MNTPKTLPPAYTLVALLAMLLLHFVLPAGRILPAPWNLLGILLLVLGIALNIQADNLFHQLGTAIKPGAESSHLVTGGPFRWSRNPMYLGLVLVLTGVAVLLGSITPFFVVPVFALLIERNFIRKEEGMLATRFGPAWQDYRQKTRRWI
jgi:protein-S-isoprenylcysteine O-methyltransferase Ste14